MRLDKLATMFAKPKIPYEIVKEVCVDATEEYPYTAKVTVNFNDRGFKQRIKNALKAKAKNVEFRLQARSCTYEIEILESPSYLELELMDIALTVTTLGIYTGKTRTIYPVKKLLKFRASYEKRELANKIADAVECYLRGYLEKEYTKYQRVLGDIKGS